MTIHSEKVSRRAAIGMASAAGVGVALADGAAAAQNSPLTGGGCVAASEQGALKWTSEFLNFDPVENFRHSWRIQRSLDDEAEILHWYHFTMVAVPLSSAPVPVVRWEGIELSRHRKIGENRFRLHGHNLSFPRDLHSGKFVDTITNPVNGKSGPIEPLTLTEDPGMFASPEGIVPLDDPQAKPRPKYAMIRRESDIVKIDGIRVPPAHWPVTFLEMGTEATPANLFFDERLTWLPADVSGSYVFPYPEWMQMGDAPGHMLGYWSGYKLRDVLQLPSEFLARAKLEFPQLLSVDSAQFDRSVAG